MVTPLCPGDPGYIYLYMLLWRVLLVSLYDSVLSCVSCVSLSNRVFVCVVVCTCLGVILFTSPVISACVLLLFLCMTSFIPVCVYISLHNTANRPVVLLAYFYITCLYMSAVMCT